MDPFARVHLARPREKNRQGHGQGDRFQGNFPEPFDFVAQKADPVPVRDIPPGCPYLLQELPVQAAFQIRLRPSRQQRIPARDFHDAIGDAQRRLEASAVHAESQVRLRQQYAGAVIRRTRPRGYVRDHRPVLAAQEIVHVHEERIFIPAVAGRIQGHEPSRFADDIEISFLAEEVPDETLLPDGVTAPLGRSPGRTRRGEDKKSQRDEYQPGAHYRIPFAPRQAAPVMSCTDGSLMELVPRREVRNRVFAGS